MNLLDTIAIVLDRSGEPLHATEITRRLLTQRRWSSNSEAPQVSVRTTLARDIRVRQASSRFQRTGAGVFALRAWGMPNHPCSRRVPAGGRTSPPRESRAAHHGRSSARSVSG